MSFARSIKKHTNLVIAKLHKKDDEMFNKLQDNINEKLFQVGQIPFMNGLQLNFVPTSNSHTVDHKLGAKPSGYFVINNLANNATFLTASNVTDQSITFEFDDYTVIKELKVWVY